MGEEEKRKKKSEEESEELDFGFGKITLGGIFKGLGKLIDLASVVAEKGEELKREGEFKGTTKSGKEVRGVYGFNIRTLAGGKPEIRTFGNIKKTPQGPVVKETREPMVDLFDEGKEIRVIAELPGVSEAAIQTELSGDILTLSAEENGKKYHKEVLLPSPVKAETLQKNFKNGILEIRFEKK